MLRRYLQMLFFFLFLCAQTAAAVETVNVLVLPFEIHASQDLSYLKKDIPKVILAHLQKEGAVAVEMDGMLPHPRYQPRHPIRTF
jgi:hypothetical protein